MTTAYRDNQAESQAAEQEKPSSEYINGGLLQRAGQSHICNVPGFWSRLWHGIHFHDKWTCTCGLEWEWLHYNDKQVLQKDTNCSCIQHAWTCSKLNIRRR